MFLLFHDVCKDCLDPVVCYVYSRSFRTVHVLFRSLHIIRTSFYDDNFTRGSKGVAAGDMEVKGHEQEVRSMCNGDQKASTRRPWGCEEELTGLCIGGQRK